MAIVWGVCCVFVVSLFWFCCFFVRIFTLRVQSYKDFLRISVFFDIIFNLFLRFFIFLWDGFTSPIVENLLHGVVGCLWLICWENVWFPLVSCTICGG